MSSFYQAHWKRFEASVRTLIYVRYENGHLAWMTPYLLLVLSVGLPVSMGSGELSSLELLAKKRRGSRWEYISCKVL